MQGYIAHIECIGLLPVKGEVQIHTYGYGTTQPDGKHDPTPKPRHGQYKERLTSRKLLGKDVFKRVWQARMGIRSVNGERTRINTPALQHCGRVLQLQP